MKFNGAVIIGKHDSSRDVGSFTLSEFDELLDRTGVDLDTRRPVAVAYRDFLTGESDFYSEGLLFDIRTSERSFSDFERNIERRISSLARKALRYEEDCRGEGNFKPWESGFNVDKLCLHGGSSDGVFNTYFDVVDVYEGFEAGAKYNEVD